ncbi:MAG: VanZ family protein [Phycisphaerae bacterium]
MPGGFLNTLFDDASRGDDRDGQDLGLCLPSGKPPVLRRRTINLIAVLGIAAILYGTLMPFEIDRSKPISWNLQWMPSMPGDAIANVLIYVPVGAFLRLMFRRRGSLAAVEWAASLVVAGGLSYLTEVAQTVVVSRVPSWIDTLCNFSGATAGIALAPLLQRVLRNAHAWLYRELRMRPMAMAAMTVMICVCTYALAPLDVKPTPTHVAKRVAHLRALPRQWLWLPGDASLNPMAVMDKVISAGAYGLLAFVLLLSAREAGRSMFRSLWYALTRSLALAVVVEAIQLFTISHVADSRDLFSAWLCCLLGCVVGWTAMGTSPDLCRSPMTLLRGLVAVISGVVLAWAVGSIVLSTPAQTPMHTTCWPAIGNFNRSWSSLLGDYTSGLLQYILVGGLIVLWSRATRHRPSMALVVTATWIIAVTSISVTAFRGYNIDTAQLILGVVGGIIAVRFDRAIFGRQRVFGSDSPGDITPITPLVMDTAAAFPPPNSRQS